MSDPYKVRIHWIAAMGYGCWTWDVWKGDEHLKHGSSFWRWTGRLGARMWIWRHKHGLNLKPRPTEETFEVQS